MIFPKDYSWHPETRMEWMYEWGRTEDKKFYHIANFRVNGKNFSHASVDGEFSEMEGANRFDIYRPLAQPVKHFAQSLQGYYSIPGNPWFDHAWGERAGLNWDWVALVLDCGMYIMALEQEGSRVCDFTMGSDTIISSFILDKKHFYIYALGAYLTLEPLEAEIIFHPKNGRPYSETPIEVVAKGEVIGYGMRERTYKPTA